LKQPFHFLAKGGQTTVYASADGRYVLKLFNNMPRSWIPFSGYRARKLKKLGRDMSAYVLAFDRLKDESALVFLHFDVKRPEPLSVCIDGKKISLQKVPFVLQKRGISLQEYQGAPEAVLEAVRTLVAKRASCGVGDDDPRLYQNIGFIDGEPFFLDPGRFVEDPEKKSGLPEKFLKWLKNS